MNVRNDFPMIRDNLIYFDNASTTLKPKTVIESINDYYTNSTSNANRGDYDLEMATNKKYNEARLKVQKFINADSHQEIVFTSGTTEGINLVANGYFKNILKENDEVIISKSEHASNILPWFNLANKIGIKIRYVELGDELQVSIENVKKAINDKTKVIALAHVTNVMGDIRPIKEIVEIARKNNVLVVVDAAQSIAHLPIDVLKLDCDFLTFSGHKMLGPTGIGVLYGKYELLNKIEPQILGGGMNESFDQEDEIILKDLPDRLEAGTRHIAGVIGLGEAIDYLENIGLDHIHRYEIDLKRYLVSKLKAIDFIDIVNPHAESGIVAFNVQGIFSQDVAIYLNKYNVCVRAGNHCAKILKGETGITNTVRVSLFLYNTKEEIDYFVNLLKDKNKILKEMI